MKLKKIIGLAGIALASVFVLAACGNSSSSSSDTTTLKVGVMTLDDATEPTWDKVTELAEEKGLHDEYNFYKKIERLAPQVIAQERNMYKGVSANVDFYSGFVYQMLGLPEELYTPLFAIARIVGWSAHRMEEMLNMNKIIRPAYESVLTTKKYKKIEDRNA